MLNDIGLEVGDFGYSSEERKLKKEIKFDIDNEDNVRLKNLVKTLVDSNSKSIVVLQQTLAYLIEENYTANVDKLKEILK